MKQFVIYIAERMLNILKLNKNNDNIIPDTVFPSFEDISYCVCNHLVSPKDHLIYKLLLDYYENLNSKEYVAPVSLKFYKSLTKKQHSQMMG